MLNESTQRILSRVLLGVLILWGAYITLMYFAVPVHQSAMLDDAGKELVTNACEGRGWLCNGLITLPATFIAVLRALGPFMIYGILSLLVLCALAMRGYMRDAEWRLRLRLSPLIVLGCFILATWGLLMSIGFSNDRGMPMRRVLEPSVALYPDISDQALEDLRANFDELKASGCLAPRGSTVSGAAAYDYRFFCMQGGYITRVISQILMLLFIIFNALVLGRAGLHALRLKGFPLLAEGTLSAGLGACFLVAILWCVAMLGIYTATAAWGLLIAVPLLGFVHSRYWLRTFYSERWEVDVQPWSLSVILAWFLVSYLALNFLNVVRPFPIGWDDLGRYMNQPRLLVSYGTFIPTIATFSWEYLTSLGFLLFGFESIFGATLSMLINWSSGVLAVCAIWLFGQTYMGRGRGILSAIVYYTLPMVGHFSFADMKVDNAIFAVGALVAYGVFLAVCPPEGLDEDDEHRRSVVPLLVMAGVFAGFVFGMKPTAIMLIMALAAVMVGVRFGWVGFVGITFMAWGLFTKQDVFKTKEVFGRVFGDPDLLSRSAFSIVCVIIGLAFLSYAARRRLQVLRETGIRLAAFFLGIVVAVLPWLISNNIMYGNWPPHIVLTAPNYISPVLVTDGPASPSKGVVRVLPLELQVDSSNAACISTSKVEELDRYWGNYPGIMHYAGLPWRAVMNVDTYGYYVTLVPALLLVPLLLLLPFFWTRTGRWARYLLGATLFMVVQWAFFANGIVWYGVNMFFGLVVCIEVLCVHSPTAATRRTAGTLVALSLLAAVSHRLWQFDTMHNIFEYPLGKVSAEAMEERTIPHYDDIRIDITKRAAETPDRPYVYRMGTFIPYFIPKNLEVFPVADNQLDVFNCLYQERDAAKTLARLQALGFNSMIFDMNTQTIEANPNGSLHKKVMAFIDFANRQDLGISIVVNDPGAGIAYILLP